MKQGLTELVCILDRSGSMAKTINEAIGGFNNFIEEQRKVEGEANISVCLFDDVYEMPFNNININDMPVLTEDTYFPRGMTALYDAVGRTINSVGQRLHNTPEKERPEKVIVMIVTDGLENASNEFSQEKIKEMIEHQREVYNWEFIFLAANQDAILNAGNMGMRKGTSVNYQHNASGTIASYAAASEASRCLRMGDDNFQFKSEDAEDYMDNQEK